MAQRKPPPPSAALLGISLCALSAGAFLLVPVAKGAPDPVPITQKRPVTDEYHGQKVVDPYRWLENIKDPAVKKWAGDQNLHARAALDAVADRAALYERRKQIVTSQSSAYFALHSASGANARGGKSSAVLFALKLQPPKEQPFLITLKSADDTASEHVVLDPNTRQKTGPEGQKIQTAIDWYEPSRDGKRVAVSLSQNGSEDGTLHVYDVQSGTELPDTLPRVQYGTGGGSVAFTPDGTGLYYTRYPAPGERPEKDAHFYQQIYFHKLGQNVADDVRSLYQDLPRIAEIVLSPSEDGRHILATVANGDGGEFAHYLLSPGAKDGAHKWEQITTFSDKVTGAFFGLDQSLYLLSRDGAPRGKLLRLSLRGTAAPHLAAAQAIIPESDGALKEGVAGQTRLYVLDGIGGLSRVRTFDLSGKPLPEVPVKPVSSVNSLVWIDGDRILYSSQSYLEPSAWYEYAPGLLNNQPRRTALYRTSPVDFGDIEVVREMATSKDGTRVPLNILRKKGTPLDSNNPTVLTGYGGFGVNLEPRFSADRHIWLEQGGVFAVANLRGGGEFGEEWHKGGYLTKKQNVFDDFFACAKLLIDRKYTSPKRLAIEGGSNGGLLMGAALTQHPELFRAVVAHVGLFDMLRFEQDPNGQYIATEYGTVKDPEQFKALHAYSPYHRVVDGAKYPAVIFLTGDNDPRVDPMNSRKMAARLQAATGSGQPVLLRTSSGSGHGIGSGLSERIAQGADVDAFLFQQLGMKYRPTQHAEATPVHN